MELLNRRDFVQSCAAFFIAPTFLTAYTSITINTSTMYGLIGKINATEGRRDELIEILLQGTRDMPGCLTYIIAKDVESADAIWITEVWESEAHHQASLELPDVQDAMAKGRPLIAGFGERFETEPVGGRGLDRSVSGDR